MNMTNWSDREPLRILVAIASYGTSNDRYLERIISEYRSMPFAVDVVVLSNIDKGSALGVECRVGLPAKNPWSLPFAHKKLFVERRDRYDLFVYSEDDILISERNLRAWLEVSATLAQDEIAGFLRVEFGRSGERSFPDAHAHFHWEPSSIRHRGGYVLAYFTNEHAACYVLNREQLGKALNSGGFDVAPHESKYDLLCTAATDPYTRCGLTKLIPVSHLEEFTVHHMSNRYIGKMGVAAEEFGQQTQALLQIGRAADRPQPLLATETKLFRAAYSKDYYEPVTQQVMALIPHSARSVLSIGCGSGAIERRLLEKGLRVAAIPLDPVIAGGAAAHGIEMIYDDVAKGEFKRRDLFDCILCLNLLHLAREPQELLSSLRGFMHRGSTLVIQAPNMMSLRELRRHLKQGARSMLFSDYETAGAHFSSVRSLRNWCANSGFKVERMFGVLAPAGEGMLGAVASVGAYLPQPISYPLATSIVARATKMQKDERELA
ncbi:methyltransferase domain-containing protein [Bradyrhizobium sp. 159]|uniref:class I SAM-dependent methyltransferase n=1 Tax=Bradyrhizobium sp. 159 TaxID=2782632 RepID=UPI001FFA3D0C|nr:methyltransferase domain-containing protein [Bradyrhizobium sp. 159]MCK1619079.1 methyltransferase domain-containing protein [Bradyrhizobium sp. 159]